MKIKSFRMPQSPPDSARPTTKTSKNRAKFSGDADADDATLIIEIALRDLSVRFLQSLQGKPRIFICRCWRALALAASCS